jgi:hypothetical protein
LPSDRMKLLNPPISRVATHGFKESGRTVHVLYSIAFSIIFKFSKIGMVDFLSLWKGAG